MAEAIARASAGADALVRPALSRLANEPEALEPLLREVLVGPCYERGTDPDARALLRAFDPGRTRSRLLLTSRYQLDLSDGPRELTRNLLDLPLPAMPDADRRKLTRRHLERLGDQAHSLAFDANRDLLARARELGLGNPGLQDRLVTLAIEAPEATAEAALAEMERYHAAGQCPQTPELVELFQRLAVEKLVGLASEADRAVLRGASLLSLQVPLAVLARLGDPSRPLALGLLDGYEDIVDPAKPAAALNDLARPHLPPLSDAEADAVAREVCEPLFTAWGGVDATRPAALDVELSQLATRASFASVALATASRAVEWMWWRNDFSAARRLGEQTLALLRQESVEPPGRLLLRLGESLDTLGEPVAAQQLLEQAYEAFTWESNERSAAVSLGSIARLIARKGQIDEALSLHKRQLTHFHEPNDPRQRAVVFGDIARLLTQKGSIESALELHTQRRLLFERAGDLQGQAVTLIDIADINVRKGNIDMALDDYQEALKFFNRLGDRRHSAIVLGAIARIESNRGNLDKAFSMHTERLTVYEAIGDRRSWAVTLGDIAQLHEQRGQYDIALSMHNREIEVYKALDDHHARAVTLGQIARIRERLCDIDGALAMQNERMSIHGRFGDPREQAFGLGDIARLTANKGDVDAAISLQQTRLEILRGLGYPEDIAAASFDLGQLLLERGNTDEATQLVCGAYEAVSRLGVLEGIAVIGVAAGQLMVAAGQRVEGLIVLRHSAAGFRQLGQVEAAARVETLIQRIEGGG